MGDSPSSLDHSAQEDLIVLAEIVAVHFVAGLMVWLGRVGWRCHLGWIMAPSGRNTVLGGVEVAVDSAFLTCWRLSHSSPLTEQGVGGELVAGSCDKSLP